MKTYFVVYLAKKGDETFKSHAGVKRERGITNYHHIVELQNDLKEKYGYDEVLIENWKRIRGE